MRLYDRILKESGTKGFTARLDEEVKARRDYYDPLAGQWELNRAMYAGRQWVTYRAHTGIIDWEQHRPRARKRYKVNIMDLFVRNMVSLLTQQVPLTHARAATAQPNDIQKAQAADALADYHRRVNRYRRLARIRALDMLLQSAGWIVVYWDDQWGPSLYDLENFNPLTTLAGAQAHQGMIRWARVHPRSVLPTPEATTLDEMRDAFIERVLPIEVIRRLWPKTGGRVKPEEGIEDYRRWRKVNLPGELRPRSKFTHHAVVREWRLHSDISPVEFEGKKYGRLVQWAGNVELYNDRNAFSDGSLGLVGARFNPGGEDVFGKTYAENLVDPQLNLNKILSQAILHRERMIAGKWAAEKRSLDSEAALRDDVVGNVVWVNPGKRYPADITGKGIDQTVFQELEMTLRLMEDVGTQQPVMRGGSTPAVRSYLQAELLKQQSHTTLSTPISEIEDADAEIVRLTLMLVQQHWDEARTIKVVGENQVARVKQFSQASIPDDIDIEVVRGSAMPKNRAAEFEELDRVSRSPLANPELKAADPEMWRALVRAYKEYGGVKESLLASYDMHAANAQRENQVIVEGAGDKVQISDADNDDIHIDEHNTFRLSTEYDALPPEIRRTIDEHKLMHDIQKDLKAMKVAYLVPQVIEEYKKTKSMEAVQQLIAAATGAGGPPAEEPGPETVGLPEAAPEEAMAGAGI